MTQHSSLFLCCALFLASQLFAPRFPQQLHWPKRRGVPTSYSSDSSIDTDSEEKSFSPKTLVVKQKNVFRPQQELFKRYLLYLKNNGDLSFKRTIILLNKKILSSYKEKLKTTNNQQLIKLFKKKLEKYFATKNEENYAQQSKALKNFLRYLERIGYLSLQKKWVKTLQLDRESLDSYKKQLKIKGLTLVVRDFKQRRHAYLEAERDYQAFLNAFFAWPFESLEVKFSDEIKYPCIYSSDAEK